MHAVHRLSTPIVLESVSKRTVLAPCFVALVSVDIAIAANVSSADLYFVVERRCLLFAAAHFKVLYLLWLVAMLWRRSLLISRLLILDSTNPLALIKILLSMFLPFEMYLFRFHFGVYSLFPPEINSFLGKSKQLK